jgi:hypothetical protein
MDDQDIWNLSDDVITYLFYPPEDGLLWCTYLDSQPYLRGHPFEELEPLCNEYYEPFLYSNYDGHEVMTKSEQ